MHDHAPILDGRVRRHLAEKIRPAETTTVCPLDVEWAPVTDTTEGPNSRPGVRGQGEPISISEGLSLSYEPFRVGDKWGPPWGTTWLHLMATVPPEHRDDHLEMIVDLGGVWDSPGFRHGRSHRHLRRGCLQPDPVGPASLPANRGRGQTHCLD